MWGVQKSENVENTVKRTINGMSSNYMLKNQGRPLKDDSKLV